MYKAVFIDMDGTLLKSDHTVSDANKNVIKELQEKNILTVLISARPLHGILPISNGVITAATPVVSLNGGYIIHHNKIIYESAVALKDAISIHNEISHYQVSPMYYSQMVWFAEKDDDRVKKEQKITPVKIIVQPFAKTIQFWEENKSGPNKILIAGDKNLINEIEARLKVLHEGKLNIYKSQPSYLEVMSMEASKANAIRFLIDRYGIRQEEIIAIGDNYNDQSMIEFAGTGVAMGNAPDQIKAVADYVTDTNNSDGVAKAIRHFIN